MRFVGSRCLSSLIAPSKAVINGFERNGQQDLPGGERHATGKARATNPLSLTRESNGDASWTVVVVHIMVLWMELTSELANRGADSRTRTPYPFVSED